MYAIIHKFEHDTNIDLSGSKIRERDIENLEDALKRAKALNRSLLNLLSNYSHHYAVFDQSDLPIVSNEIPF